MNLIQNLQSKKSYLLFVSVVILFAMNGYLTYLFSSTLSSISGYENLNTIFNNQLLSFLAGIFIIFILSHLNNNIWFNRIGAVTFLSSLGFLIAAPFVNDSLLDYSSIKKIFVIKDSIYFDPMLFLSIGSLWLISWVNSKKDIKYTNTTIVILMMIAALFCLALHNISMLVMFEVVFISVAFYLNGINKFTLFVSIVSFALGILYILMSDYILIHRIKLLLLHHQDYNDYMINLSITNALHENILFSLINSVGIFSLVIVISLFLFIIYLIVSHTYKNKSFKIFAVGVFFLLLTDLVFNILYIFGLSPVYPPTLYLFGYGSSAVIASSLMIGMLMMIMRNTNEAKKSKKIELALVLGIGLLLIIGSMSAKYEKRIEHNIPLRAKIITDDNITVAYTQEVNKLIVLNKFTKEQFSKLLDRLSKVIDIDKQRAIKKYFGKNKRILYQVVSYGVTKKDIPLVKQIIDSFVLENSLSPSEKYYQIELSGEKRVYPYKYALTPVMGSCRKLEKHNLTYLKGVKGIENYYDAPQLTSLNKKRKDIHLNIDLSLQKYIEKEVFLKKADIDADEVISIIINPETYDIEAFASTKRFNPNKIKKGDIDSLNISAVEKLFHVGWYIWPIKNAIRHEKGLKLKEGYRKFGFYNKSGIDLNYEKITKNTLDVNLIQLLKMYAVFYNGGKIAAPSIAKHAGTKHFKQIISKENAKRMIKILQSSQEYKGFVTVRMKDSHKRAFINFNADFASEKELQITMAINPRNDFYSDEVKQIKMPDDFPYIVVQVYRQGTSDFILRYILYSKKNRNIKIGEVEPINKYQAQNGAGSEREAEGFYQDKQGNYYIDRLTDKGTKLASCNACQKYNVETLKVTDHGLVVIKSSLRKLDDTYKQFTGE